MRPAVKRFTLTRSIWIALGLATVWLAAACLRMGWQPILADEWDFYRAMTHWPVDRVLIPHPQGYIHVAQFFQAIFGQTIGTARLAGVISAVVSVWLIPVLVAFVYPERTDRSRITVLAIAFTALNPLTLQNAMLLDIDNTLLIPATLLLAIAWAALYNRPARARLIVLSVLLALALWVKLPTPPLLIGALFLYHLVRGEWKRAGEVIVIALLGLLLFGLTFEIYTLGSGYQWAYFGPTFARSGGFFNLRDLVARFPQGLGVFVLWFSLPLTVLLLMVVLQTVRRVWRKQTVPADALTFYVVIVAVLYPLIYIPAWGYPRYQSPIVPIALMLIAALVSPYTLSLSRRAWAACAALAAGLIVVNLLLLPDPLYPIYATTFEGGLYDLSTRLSAALRVLGVMAAPIGIVLGAGWLIGHRQNRRAVIINLLAVLAIAAISTEALVQINATYSTRYRYTYDYADYWWTVQRARALGSDATILAIKDTLQETGLQGEEIYPYLSASQQPSLLDTIRTRRIDALIWTTKEESRSTDVTTDPRLVAALARCYNRETRGVFIVYTLKAGVTCQ